jgi:inosine-uridine nucleoside N-ribohydrolase
VVYKKADMKFKLLILAVIAFAGCNDANKNNEAIDNKTEPVNVIFDTDMGNDVDDVLAIDMLYKYADQQKIHFLGVLSTKYNTYSVPFIHLLNEWYGYETLPVGTVENGADSEGDSRNYAEAVWLMQKDGKQLFNHPDTSGKYHEATRLYRKLLAKQKDSSIVIVSVGFSTNIARLLASPADDLSPLNGKELVAKKVKLLSVMAGNFNGQNLPEYNVVKDIPAAQQAFSNWPGVIVFTPFELGIRVNYPAVSIENDFTWANPHPLVEAYKYYLDMPYDRPSWDLLSVLYAVEGEQYFEKSVAGTVTVNDKGITTFQADPNGLHYYLNASDEQTDAMLTAIKNLVTQKPKALK